MSETTGLQSAITYTESVAAAHTAHASGLDDHLTGADYGEAVLTAVAAAQQASADAGARWAHATGELRRCLTVTHAYAAAPDAAGKVHLLGVDADTGPTGATLNAAQPAEPARPAVDPAARRRGTMRDLGVYACPDWCTQDSEEDQYEDHWGADRTLRTGDGDTITVRPRMSWWTDGPATVEVAMTPAENNTSVVLDPVNVMHLQTLIERAQADAEYHHVYDDPARLIPAYDGAPVPEDGYRTGVDETEGPGDATVLDVSPGMVAVDARHYLDWSVALPDGGRSIEVGAGDTAAVLDLPAPHLHEFRDRLDRSLQPDAGHDDFGVEFDDGAYLDWSVQHDDGSRELEAGHTDADDAVVLQLSAAHLRALRDQLAADTAEQAPTAAAADLLSGTAS